MVKRSRLSRYVKLKKLSRMKPFTVGKDARGDVALFIPVGAKMGDTSLVQAIKSAERDYSLGFSEFGVFFRLVDEFGNQLSTHGWIKVRLDGIAEVIQYG